MTSTWKVLKFFVLGWSLMIKPFSENHIYLAIGVHKKRSSQMSISNILQMMCGLITTSNVLWSSRWFKRVCKLQNSINVYQRMQIILMYWVYRKMLIATRVSYAHWIKLPTPPNSLYILNLLMLLFLKVVLHNFTPNKYFTASPINAVLCTCCILR